MNAGSSLRILVVEDEALLAMDLEAVIQDEGHSVVGEAACAKSAEDLPDDTNPDLAFVDLQLANGSNGLDVSGMINRRWPTAIVVFVTANPKRIPPNYEGAYGIITKPFSHAGVAQALRYLGEGIADPPPSTETPEGLFASNQLLRRLTSVH